jgi:prepilin-type N-terminal cleavage/methylation domain-containing protein
MGCKFTRKKAFTMLEVLIVLVVISILFILLVSRVDFSVTSSKEMTVQTDFITYQIALEEVCLEQKALVGDMTLLRDYLNKHLDSAFFVEADGGSLTTSRLDPWGKEYYFEYSRDASNLGKMTIVSCGVDKKMGTADDLSMYVEYKNTPYGYKVVKELANFE